MTPRPKNPTTAYGVRMTPGLVAKVKRLAREENRSFNGQIIQLLHEALEARGRCRPTTATEAGQEKEGGGTR